MVDAWQLDTWEAYRDAARLGRRRGLPETRRQLLWPVFVAVQAALQERGQVTSAGMYERLVAEFSQREYGPYDVVVVDESQDLSVAQLRFLAALVGDKPNGLFLAGDLGQRIFQQPFSWRELGVDVRGRSRTFRINYRTSHQIRSQADLLLDPQISDVDGNVEERKGMVSVSNGPDPVVRVLDGEGDEIAAVAEWLADIAAERVNPEEMSNFVRTGDQLDRAIGVVEKAGLTGIVLATKWEPQPALYRSVPCTWPRGLSSVPSPSWPVTTK